MIRDQLSAAMTSLIRKSGQPIEIRYYSQTIGSVWDDEVTLSQSGTSLWASGIVLPVTGKQGTAEAILMEQGKLIDGDKRLYVDGTIGFIGSEFQVKIQLGSISEPTEFYTTIPIGLYSPGVSNQRIYGRQYIRRMTGSLLIGE